MRRRPALAASVLTLGASITAMVGIVALLARDDPSALDDRDGQGRLVEVRIGNDVTDDQARAAVRAWLEDQPDLGQSGALRVVDAPPDTITSPS